MNSTQNLSIPSIVFEVNAALSPDAFFLIRDEKVASALYQKQFSVRYINEMVELLKGEADNKKLELIKYLVEYYKSLRFENDEIYFLQEGLGNLFSKIFSKELYSVCQHNNKILETLSKIPAKYLLQLLLLSGHENFKILIRHSEIFDNYDKSRWPIIIELVALTSEELQHFVAHPKLLEQLRQNKIPSGLITKMKMFLKNSMSSLPDLFAHSSRFIDQWIDVNSVHHNSIGRNLLDTLCDDSKDLNTAIQQNLDSSDPFRWTKYPAFDTVNHVIYAFCLTHFVCFHPFLNLCFTIRDIQLPVLLLSLLPREIQPVSSIVSAYTSWMSYENPPLAPYNHTYSLFYFFKSKPTEGFSQLVNALKFFKGKDINNKYKKEYDHFLILLSYFRDGVAQALVNHIEKLSIFSHNNAYIKIITNLGKYKQGMRGGDYDVCNAFFTRGGYFNNICFAEFKNLRLFILSPEFSEFPETIQEKIKEILRFNKDFYYADQNNLPITATVVPSKK